MPPLDQLLYSRRSIRKYTQQIPSQALIREMIHCALCAPSPSNSQPVRFFRIRSTENREALHAAMVSGRQYYLERVKKQDNPKQLRNRINAYWRYSEFMFHAPLLFAAGTKTDVVGFSGHLRKAHLFEEDQRVNMDMGIAMGLALKGFIIKAHELGLGTCVLTAPLVFASDPEKILELPRFHISCYVAAGYPDEAPPRPKRITIDDAYKEI